jgi:hypothetical protein
MQYGPTHTMYVTQQETDGNQKCNKEQAFKGSVLPGDDATNDDEESTPGVAVDLLPSRTCSQLIVFLDARSTTRISERWQCASSFLPVPTILLQVR